MILFNVRSNTSMIVRSYMCLHHQLIGVTVDGCPHKVADCSLRRRNIYVLGVVAKLCWSILNRAQVSQYGIIDVHDFKIAFS